MTDTTAPGGAGLDAAAAPFPLPRVTIRFCTQCKWMLRAAYFAQELLSTFSTALGEVALQPSTGGTFVVEISHIPGPLPSSNTTATEEESSNTIAAASAGAATAVVEIQSRVLWDRKVDGGFPETKELKRRVRDVIEPGRNLGHVDKDYGAEKKKEKEREQQEQKGDEGNAKAAGGSGGPPAGPRWAPIQKSQGASPSPAASSSTTTPPSAAAPSGQQQQDQPPPYGPKLPHRGGVMPLAPPGPGHSKVPSATSKPEEGDACTKEEECEDCK